MAKQLILTRRSALAGVIGGGFLLTAGCSFTGESEAGREGAKVLRWAQTNVKALDTQLVTDGQYLVPKGLLEGLVVENPDGTGVVAAMAEKWEVSDDGLTYTFAIRDNAKWSNGDKVTAKDFEWTFKRLITPKGGNVGNTAGANSFQLEIGIVGAKDFLNGTITDWTQVGIKATDDSTLEIKLEKPKSDFLMFLAHYSMLCYHPATLEKHGDKWSTPEFWVGNGPFVLSEWTVNTGMKLKANEHYWDKKNVFVDTIEIKFVEDAVQILNSYRNNEIDVCAADYKVASKDAALKDQLVGTKPYSVAYLAVMRSENPALTDPRVRKALSLGLDREIIAKISPGSSPGISLIPQVIPGWNDSITVDFNPDEGKRLLAEAGFPNGSLPEIKLLSNSDNPALQAVADVWGTNLGIKVKQDVVEAGVYVDRRWKVQNRDYIGFYFGTFSGLLTLNSYTQTIWGPEFTQQFSLPVNIWKQYQTISLDTKLKPDVKSAQLAQLRAQHASAETKQFGDLVIQAQSAPDPKEQEKLLLEAAKVRQETYLFLPLLWNSTWIAKRPEVSGVQLRPSANHFYFKGVKVDRK